MLKYFKETTARKQWHLDCGHVCPVGENYWRCGQETMCAGCKKRIEERVVKESDAYWEGLWQYANENISDYVLRYGRSSDYEQVMMEDYEKQNPRPNIVFIPKKR
jgi:hypothetical protein